MSRVSFQKIIFHDVAFLHNLPETETVVALFWTNVILSTIKIGTVPTSAYLSYEKNIIIVKGLEYFSQKC